MSTPSVKRIFVAGSILASEDGLHIKEEILATNKDDKPQPVVPQRKGTLYEQLKENKEMKDLEMKKIFKNLPPKALDEFEVEFLRRHDEQRRDTELRKRREVEESNRIYEKLTSTRIKPVEEKPESSVFSSSFSLQKEQKEQKKDTEPFRKKRRFGMINIIKKDKPPKKQK